MTSLIVIYFLLIIIQRAVSVLFSDFPNTSIFAQQIFGIFLPVAIYYAFIKKENYIEKSDLKIKISHIPFVFLSGFCMQFFASFINFPVIILLENLKIDAPKMAEIPSGIEVLYYIFLICVLPAVFEEVLFRKLTFRKLSGYGKLTALLLTSVIFAIMHFNLYSVVPLLFAGFIMTFLVYKRFPLIYSVIFHFSMNLSGVILDIINKDENVAILFAKHFPIFGTVCGIFVFAFLLYIKEGFNENI